jgi:hypothetical protein
VARSAAAYGLVSVVVSHENHTVAAASATLSALDRSTVIPSGSAVGAVGVVGRDGTGKLHVSTSVGDVNGAGGSVEVSSVSASVVHADTLTSAMTAVASISDTRVLPESTDILFLS